MNIEYNNNKHLKIYHRKSGDVVRLLDNYVEQESFTLVLKQDREITRCFDLSNNTEFSVSSAVKCIHYPKAKLKPGKGER